MFGRNKVVKRRVEKVVEDNYWDGFFGYLECESSTKSLEYGSASGYYAYNEAANIAYKAGWEYCESFITERDRKLAHNEEVKRTGKGHRYICWFTIDRKIPAHVYADAYASMRISA